MERSVFDRTASNMLNQLNEMARQNGGSKPCDPFAVQVDLTELCSHRLQCVEGDVVRLIRWSHSSHVDSRNSFRAQGEWPDMTDNERTSQCRGIGQNHAATIVSRQRRASSALPAGTQRHLDADDCGSVNPREALEDVESDSC